eukprot:gene7665-28078_t
MLWSTRSMRWSTQSAAQQFLKVYMNDGTYRMVQTSPEDTCETIIARLLGTLKGSEAYSTENETTPSSFVLFQHLKGSERLVGVREQMDAIMKSNPTKSFLLPKSDFAAGKYPRNQKCKRKEKARNEAAIAKERKKAAKPKAPKEEPYDFEAELEAMRDNGSVISLEQRLVAFDAFSSLDDETLSDSNFHNWDDDDTSADGVWVTDGYNLEVLNGMDSKAFQKPSVKIGAVKKQTTKAPVRRSVHPGDGRMSIKSTQRLAKASKAQSKHTNKKQQQQQHANLALKIFKSFTGIDGSSSTDLLASLDACKDADVPPPRLSSLALSSSSSSSTVASNLSAVLERGESSTSFETVLQAHVDLNAVAAKHRGAAGFSGSNVLRQKDAIQAMDVFNSLANGSSSATSVSATADAAGSEHAAGNSSTGSSRAGSPNRGRRNGLAHVLLRESPTPIRAASNNATADQASDSAIDSGEAASAAWRKKLLTPAKASKVKVGLKACKTHTELERRLNKQVLKHVKNEKPQTEFEMAIMHRRESKPVEDSGFTNNATPPTSTAKPATAAGGKPMWMQEFINRRAAIASVAPVQSAAVATPLADTTANGNHSGENSKMFAEIRARRWQVSLLVERKQTELKLPVASTTNSSSGGSKSSPTNMFAELLAK